MCSGTFVFVAYLRQNIYICYITVGYMHYSESDTRANFIDPLLQDCGWNSENLQREYYFTDGRKILNNKRGKRKFVDYLLKNRNVNLAILEAKSSDKHPTEGLQQAIDYASVEPFKNFS